MILRVGHVHRTFNLGWPKAGGEEAAGGCSLVGVRKGRPILGLPGVDSLLDLEGCALRAPPARVVRMMDTGKKNDLNSLACLLDHQRM